jgi:hypothetical protein
MVGVAGAVAVAAGASVAVALGGHRAPAPSHASLPVAAPMPNQCAIWTCKQAQTEGLGNDYTITMWHAGKPGDFHTDPVVELSRDGVSVQWWLWPKGYGWAGALTCQATAAEPHCVLTDGDGVHSAVAQLVLLQSGRLAAPKDGAVVADLPTVLARDLDDDADLDVVALDSDYTPSFAQGHVYWHTYRNDAGHLTSTGCVLRGAPTDPVPTRPLTGPCPDR